MESILEAGLNTLMIGNKLEGQEQITEMFKQAEAILITEPNVVQISGKVLVVGDLKGQVVDLIRLLNTHGMPSDQKYLFLGSNVNNGPNSVETLQLLILLKLKYPSNVTLLRGNYESRGLSQVYGFYDEINTKYPNDNLREVFMSVCDYLPLCAILNKNIFCVHGGLAPEIETIEQVNQLDRFHEIPHEGPICDMLWSDPDDGIEGYGVSPRGAGYIFGSDVAKSFLERNHMKMIIRGHQMQNEGYAMLFHNTLVSLFSAPNYKQKLHNQGAVAMVGEDNAIQYFVMPKDE